MDNEKNMIVKELRKKRSQSLIKANFESTMKCLKLSHRYRTEGNKLFRKDKPECSDKDDLQREEIFKLYSKSIASAPCDSKDLALAYQYRSAILFRMKKYRESNLDIERAMKINKLDDYCNIELLCRKVECLAIQGLPESKGAFSDANQLLIKLGDEDKRKEELLEMISKAKPLLGDQGSNVGDLTKSKIPEHIKILNQKEMENPFDSVSIGHNQKYGRCLIANHDYKPGEIVFVQKPYVKVLNLNNAHMYCCHCLTISWATIPCDYCSWGMFCSEECKNEAWQKYHDIECIIIAQLIERQIIDEYQQLSIRALIMAVREEGGIKNLRNELVAINKSTDERTKGFLKDGQYGTIGFKSVFTLDSDIVKDYMNEYTTNSVFILISLMRYTSFFNDDFEIYSIKSLLNNKKVLLIGSLLLKLYKISKKNHQRLNGEKRNRCNKDTMTCHKNKCCFRGYCIVPVYNLLNHSCDPNVEIVITRSQKFIVFTLVPVKKNSQIFINYQDILNTFYDQPREERQRFLKKHFNFVCDCPACKEDWPTMITLINLFNTNNLLWSCIVGPREVEYITRTLNNGIFETTKITNWDKIHCNQEEINKLIESIIEAAQYLKHPSMVLGHFVMVLTNIFINLYETCS